MNNLYTLPTVQNESVSNITLSSEALFERLRNWSDFQYLLPYFVQFSCCSYGTENLYRGNEIKLKEKDLLLAVQQHYATSDILIVGGWVSKKLSPYLLEIYHGMLFPRWVVSIGACASAGGPFKSYAIENGISSLFPVDIYVPGCPPSETAIIEGLRMLQERVEKRECSALGAR